MKKVIVITGIVISALLCFAETPDYDAYMRTICENEDSLQYEAAYELCNIALSVFYDREFDIMKEMIYINSKTGQYEKNIEIWQQGHEKGYFFFIIPGMEQYKPYEGIEGFDSIVMRDSELRAAANANNKIEYKVVYPENYDAEKQYPAVFILHGGGSSIEKAEKNWAIPPAMRNRYIYVYFQSYIRLDYNTYGWKKKDIDVAVHFSVLLPNLYMETHIDTCNIYLCGVSAGGSEAIDLALRDVVPLKGLFCICPGIPEPVDTNELTAMKDRHVKIYFLSGENDFYLQRQKDFLSIADFADYDYRFEIIEGMGHGMPEGLDDKWPTVMEYLSK